MTTAQDAILTAWQPLLERQHVAVRMILERHSEQLARLAVAVICPTEGERLASRFETVSYLEPDKFMRSLEQLQADPAAAVAEIEQAWRNAQRDFA